MGGKVESIRIPDLDKGSLIDRYANIKVPVHFDEFDGVLMERNSLDYVATTLLFPVFCLSIPLGPIYSYHLFFLL